MKHGLHHFSPYNNEIVFTGSPEFVRQGSSDFKHLLQNLLPTMRLCSPGSSEIVEQSSSSDFKHTFVAKSFAGWKPTSHRVFPFPQANSLRRFHTVQVLQCSSHHLVREYACLSPEPSLHVHSSQRKEQMPPPKLVSMASFGLPSISAKNVNEYLDKPIPLRKYELDSGFEEPWHSVL